VTLITTNATGNDTLVLSGYITVYATPAFPTITQNGSTLTSSPASGYQWQFNSVDIAGATNQSYTATQNGFYTVIVSDSNGCVNSTTLYVDVTGIDDLPDGILLSIYPNPSGGNLVIDASGIQAGSIIAIKVINSLGQIIYASTEIISSPFLKKNLTLDDAPPGIYFLEISTDNAWLKRKITLIE
jgi:PKD repeat protein